MSLACSIVIPTYNAADTLGEQLEALAKQETERAFEVIVADNGSSDGSTAVALRWTAALQLRVVDASARRGPSAARNIGAAHASAPVLLFCDADDVVSPLWVEALAGALAKQPFVGGAYLPFATRSGVWLPNYGIDGLPVAWNRTYAFGGNLGIRLTLFSELGGFDESLTGAEEIELAWRAHDAGAEMAFVPQATVAYRVRSNIRGRLWHEYNSGRGTTTLASRLVPETLVKRSWKSQARHFVLLVSRYPRSLSIPRWVAWAGTIAFEIGSRAARRETTS